MTRRPDPLTAAHLAYINALRSGGHAYCEDYVGRYAPRGAVYTEMADGIAFTAMGADGQPKNWFVPDDDKVSTLGPLASTVKS
jgi:hypothetical protein